MSKHRRYIIYTTLLALFFAFYPGDGPYLHLFAYNRELFATPYSFTVPRIKTPFITTPAPTDLTAESVLVTHLGTFTPILDKNSRTPLYPASTLKILTALTAYDVYNINDTVAIRQATPEGQIMGLTWGERMSIDNLLNATLVYSANDAAEALANVVGREKFIDLMQKKARELGLTQTVIKNPTGLDEEGQVTTAYDLTLAARELLKNPYLANKVSTKEIIIANADFSKFYTLTNTNKNLGDIIGLGGLKTGYTELAGENLVSYFVWKGEQYILVVMKSKDRFADSKKIVDWIKNGVEIRTLY